MSSPVKNFPFTAEECANVRKPIADARTFPRQAYTSEEVYQLEVEKIYQRRWIAIGFECEVADAGDVLPKDVCDMPVVLVRTEAGELRAYHNICPYDGCPVAFEAGKKRQNLVTPYHGWTYALTGELVAAPYWSGKEATDFAPLEGLSTGLAPIHVATWGGVIFINMAENPQSFADYIKPVERLMADYGVDQTEVMVDAEGVPLVSEKEVAGNWKTHCENACINFLHEHFVHDLYRASPEVPRVDEAGKKKFCEIVDADLLGFEYLEKDTLQTYPVPEEIPHIGHSADKRPTKGNFSTHYPNLYISAHPVYIEIGIALPDGPGKTKAARIIRMHPEMATGEEAAPLRQLVDEGFAGAAAEDKAIVEAVQRARYSPAYSDKFYSPFWDVLHHQFNILVLNDLEAEA